ncbi:MAG: RNA 2',3'-cyclic phosphodiesterase [Candidatus Nanohaloarchaea archaeon]|nr:RNA 2',3'-cyclic phosphodiesterase [Candidatus Nanohaloarchaea archaeon]
MARRCFISVDIQDSTVTRKLSAVQDEIAGLGQNSCTDPGQFHFTMNFIGDVHEEDLNRIQQRLQDVNHDSFTLSLVGLGAFPDRDYIKVVWCGARSDELHELSTEIREQLPEQYVQDQEFHPHVTLLRLHNISREEKQQLQEKLASYEDHVFGQMQVDQFALKESIRRDSGAEHRVIKEFGLP